MTRGRRPEEDMAEEPSSGSSPTNRWDLSARITVHQLDLVSPVQVQGPATSVAMNASPAAEGQRILSVLLSSRGEAGLAPDMNAMALRLAAHSAAPILGLLESLRCGGFFLDPRGRVLSLNATARACLGDELVLGAGHLRATDRATDDRLQAMADSAKERMGDPNAPTSVTVQRRSRLPLVIRAARLDQGADWAPGSVSLLLLALDPELRREPSREMLTQAFGLTPVEADIAIGIVAGRTLAQIAGDRGVTIGTVRVLSKRVFSKTYTHGQAELTGLLTRLAFLVPVDGYA
jgi:DNA-binding CsgD family transcriptional regulator